MSPLETTQPSESPAQLSRGAFALSLLVLLGIFTFLNPIWEDHAMSAWDENIGWSYVPIPALVLFFLLLERKWSGPAFLLESLKLTFVKFVLTFLAANAIWAVWGIPGTGLESGGAVVSQASASGFEPRPAPAPTPLGGRVLGILEGVVEDAQGRAVPGAMVWVSEGLEGLVFAPPAEELVLEHRGDGFEPGFALVQAWQGLRLRSLDRELHTVVLREQRGRQLTNFPLIASGELELMFARTRGPLELSCSVHGVAEPPTTLLVSGTPFQGRADSSGRFRFEGVPGEALVLCAFGPGRGAGQLHTTPSPEGGPPLLIRLLDERVR